MQLELVRCDDDAVRARKSARSTKRRGWQLKLIRRCYVRSDKRRTACERDTNCWPACASATKSADSTSTARTSISACSHFGNARICTETTTASNSSGCPDTTISTSTARFHYKLIAFDLDFDSTTDVDSERSASARPAPSSISPVST